MSSTIVEYVFDSRNNTNILQLQNDPNGGTDFTDTDLTGTTKVEVIFDDSSGTSYNSTDDADYISFDTNGEVTLSLGNSGLANGSYKAYFVVYDPLNLDGIRWSPMIRIKKI